MILSEGQILFHEGDSGNNLYVVRSGILQGRNTRGDSNTYEAGDLIGELSLLKNEPCPETVIATEDSELLEITPENLNETQEQEPVWFKSIIQFMTGRLSIAQSNKHKSDKIKALPSLLYILDSKATRNKTRPAGFLLGSSEPDAHLEHQPMNDEVVCCFISELILSSDSYRR
jgi:CRP-like cAMP-binding protein